MKITVYGPGCDKCKKLYAVAEEAIRQAGVVAELEKVEGVIEIAKAGVMFTPALAVEGKVKVSGKVPEVAKVVEWVKAAAER
jgi:small redox-active disulfide protein 2